jgi:hypothetical protein
MPVRSLHSSVLAWPRRQEVEAGVTSWAQEVVWVFRRDDFPGFSG